MAEADSIQNPSRRFRRRLDVQLTLAFLISYTVSGLLLIFAALWLVHQVYSAALQGEGRTIAANLAAELTPHLGKTVDIAELLADLETFVRYSPTTEVFFFDREGNPLPIAFGGALVQSPIDVRIVEEFLSQPQTAGGPRYIRHPITKEQVVFSAARVETPSGSGYLIVPLQSYRFGPAISYLLENLGVATALIGMFALIGLTSVAAVTLFRLLTKRFYHLLEVVRWYQRGDFTRRVEINSRNELGELANAINTMADTIQSNIKALEQRDALRRELIANVSHDLRAPVGSIVSLADALEATGKAMSKEDLAKYLGGIVNAGESLTQLIDELFDLSKFETGSVIAKLEPLSISQLAENARLRFLARAAEQEITLQVIERCGSGEVMADGKLLVRVFDNLIANAFRFTSRGGTIALRLEDCGDRVKVAVADTGSGIAAEDLPRVFERTFMGTDSKGGGMGLGLAIVGHILRLHQANIEVASELNAGTEFSFTLQRSPAAREENAEERQNT